MKTISINNLQLVESRKYTYLSADVASGASSLTVQNISGVAIDQVLLVGDFGKENSEIILTHSATAPSGSTVTLASNTAFAHTRGTKVTILAYDKVEVSTATTLAGTKTVLATAAIQADDLVTLYDDSTATVGYYFYRFNNSLTAAFSDYSAAIPFAGFADNSAFMLKKRAMEEMGEEIGTLISDERLNQYLNEGRRELDNNPLVLRWSFRQKYDQDVDTVVPGKYKMAVPADLKDPNTYKNIWGLRIGKSGEALTYKQPLQFKQCYENIPHTTLNGTVGDADVTIVLADSGDFDESGAIIVGATAATGVTDNINYTGNTESTNTLTGVTGIATGGHATGADVWQNVTLGLPRNYTIIDGYIYFDVPFEDDLAGESIYMDYYSTITPITDDATEVDEPEYDMFVSYLKYRIKSLKSTGKLKREDDPDYADWKERSGALINKEVSNQDIYLIPS